MERFLKINFVLKIFILIGFIFANFPASSLWANENFTQERISLFKKAVVNLKVSSSRYFKTTRAGTFFGTGFIVDKKRGLLVTVKHLVSENPSHIKISFYDGESTYGKLIYYDFTHDFSVIQFNPKEVTTELEEVALGSYYDLKAGDPLLLIGNNERVEYSIKQGEVVGLVKNKGSRHSLSFLTSFDRTGGSSGAPVWNKAWKVVGIHFKGTNTSSFELPIDYVLPKLASILEQKPIVRGEIGLQLNLLKIADAKKYLNFPEKLARQQQKIKEEINDVIYVKATIPGLPYEKEFESGDILIKVGDLLIGEDLLLFDKLIDEKVGKTVTITLNRRGREIVRKVKVSNAESFKIKRFVVFGGGTFHDFNPNLRLRWNADLQGVYLSQTNWGSNMSEVGSYGNRNVKDQKAVIVHAINGHQLSNLENFIQLIKSGLRDKQHITINYTDIYYSTVDLKMLRLDLTLTPTKIYHFDSTHHIWVVENL